MTTRLIGRYRWRICAVLFFATTINYVDRNVFSFAMLDDVFRHQMLGLPHDAPLSDADLARFKEYMGYVDAAFKFAYAVGFLLAGRLIDSLGTRRGFSISIGVWSLAGMAHGLVHSLSGMAATRFLLGLGEAGNFPAAVKSVAEWFPKKERSFATGLFNAGANVGIIVTALCVPWLISHFGWRMGFLATGALGFAVLAIWVITFRPPERHPRLSSAEFAYIRQDAEEEIGRRVLKWRRLLPFRQTWAFAIGKFLTDAVWWFYLTWLPTFFNDNPSLAVKLDLKQIGVPFLIIYLFSDVGSVFFGWLATRLINAGWSANRARKTTMLVCALCVVPILFAPLTGNLSLAIALIALAAAAHQGWSANLFTTVSDMFPRSAVGSVVGIGGLAGAVGGALLAAGAGWIIARFGYMPLFAYGAFAYGLAWVIIQILAPRLQPVVISDNSASS